MRRGSGRNHSTPSLVFASSLDKIAYSDNTEGQGGSQEPIGGMVPGTLMLLSATSSSHSGAGLRLELLLALLWSSSLFSYSTFLVVKWQPEPQRARLL